jgi:hypothetical protein
MDEQNKLTILKPKYFVIASFQQQHALYNPTVLIMGAFIFVVVRRISEDIVANKYQRRLPKPVIFSNGTTTDREDLATIHCGRVWNGTRS